MLMQKDWVMGWDLGRVRGLGKGWDLGWQKVMGLVRVWGWGVQVSLGVLAAAAVGFGFGHRLPGLFDWQLEKGCW
jgi:hypothetical protein